MTRTPLLPGSCLPCYPAAAAALQLQVLLSGMVAMLSAKFQQLNEVQCDRLLAQAAAAAGSAAAPVSNGVLAAPQQQQQQQGGSGIMALAGQGVGHALAAGDGVRSMFAKFVGPGGADGVRSPTHQQQQQHAAGPPQQHQQQQRPPPPGADQGPAGGGVLGLAGRGGGLGAVNQNVLGGLLGQRMTEGMSGLGSMLGRNMSGTRQQQQQQQQQGQQPAPPAPQQPQQHQW